MKKTRLFLFVLLFILTFSTFSYAAVNKEALFLSNAGIMVGSGGDLNLDGTFTVEQLMTVLSRLQDQEAVAKSYKTTDLFRDVPKDRWSAPYIAWAKATGLSKGNPDGTIGYLEPVTAQRLCAFLLRTLGYTQVAWADVFEEAANLGLMDSVDVAPGEALKRGDVAKMVYQALIMPGATGQTLSERLELDRYIENEKMSAAEISKLVSPAVVYIETYDASGEMLASGSGFILTPDGKVATNYHVLAGSDSALIRLIDGSSYEVGRITAYDQLRDVAVFRVNGSGLPTVSLGNSDLALSGESILTIGSPIGLENTIADGLISNTNRIVDEMRYLQISAPISSGSSGGVLLNYAGEVIGITSASFIDGQNLNLAIPINEVKSYFEEDGQYALTDLYDPYAYSEEELYADYESLYYDDGTYYYGQVENGVPQGEGSMYFSNGDVYTGTWTDGLMDGYGEYAWADGEFYSGDWLMDARTGYGYYSWTDGSSYGGDFVDGYMHGYGTAYYADDTYISGEWAYDELVRVLPAPANLKGVLQSDGSVKLTWGALSEAEGFYVYYSEDGEGWNYMDFTEETSMMTPWQMLKGERMYFVVTAWMHGCETGDSNVIVVER